MEIRVGIFEFFKSSITPFFLRRIMASGESQVNIDSHTLISCLPNGISTLVSMSESDRHSTFH